MKIPPNLAKIDADLEGKSCFGRFLRLGMRSFWLERRGFERKGGWGKVRGGQNTISTEKRLFIRELSL